MGRSTSKLDRGTIEELVDKTGFSSKEIRQWYRSFQADCPKFVVFHGSFTAADLNSIYAQFFPTGDTHRFSAHVFRTFDKDGNGHVDFPEFITGLSVVLRGDAEDKLRWAFTMYDLDCNGEIERPEMIEVMKSLYNMRSSEFHLINEAKMKADLLFEKLDKKRSGKITVEQFIEAAKHDPNIIDLLKGD